jgi:hypothetical protein
MNRGHSREGRERDTDQGADMSDQTARARPEPPTSNPPTAHRSRILGQRRESLFQTSWSSVG